MASDTEEGNENEQLVVVQTDRSAPNDGSSKAQMAWLLLASMFIASANTLLYKATLNAFSSPTTNYGFFASQFSIVMYVIQALLFSVVIIYRDPKSIQELFQIPHSIYVNMGFLDSASGTLGAIAGVRCPGELQTILNQLIIPITMIGAAVMLKSKFASFQIWGSAFIVIGAIIASSNYAMKLLFGEGDSAVDTTLESVTHRLLQSSDTTNSAAASSVAMASAAVALYFVSIIPSALSNIYKESKMKDQDMNEVHTSTIVAFWQLWFGFLFLPLMSLPSLGGLTYEQMTMQISDGWACFLGSNPNDPEGDCSNAAVLLMSYIMVNFVYNIIMLAITKRGSAVLLVISQALSLPVTNIAFTLKIFMGDAAEPLTIVDLIGLILVCIGFLTYSGFGFASNFMVAQGPPGQMAYVHFEGVSETIVSTKITRQPAQLVAFLVTGIWKELNSEYEHALHRLRRDFRAPSTDATGQTPERKHRKYSNDCETGDGEDIELIGSTDRSSHIGYGSSLPALPSLVEPSQLDATRAALDVAKKVVKLLQSEVHRLETNS